MRRRTPEGRLIDNRHGSRYRMLAVADMNMRDGSRHTGLVYNISQDGMFVLSGARPEVNKPIDMHVTDSGSASVRINGIVVHSSKERFGLMFGDLDDRAQRFVRENVHQRRHPA